MGPSGSGPSCYQRAIALFIVIDLYMATGAGYPFRSVVWMFSVARSDETHSGHTVQYQENAVGAPSEHSG
jgi:hypothetical protein